MILVVARLQIGLSGSVEFRRAFEEVRAASLLEEGAISYRALVGLVDRGEVVFIEEWEDRASLERHFSQPHFAAFDAKLQTLMVGDPEVVVHEIERSERL